jgi:molecular chaperone DnaK
MADTEKMVIEEELKSAEEVLERNREAATSTSPRRVQLRSAAHKVAEAMYKQAGATEGQPGPGPEGGGGGAAPKESDVIDAEFEDKSS